MDLVNLKTKLFSISVESIPKRLTHNALLFDTKLHNFGCSLVSLLAFYQSRIKKFKKKMIFCQGYYRWIFYTAELVYNLLTQSALFTWLSSVWLVYISKSLGSMQFILCAGLKSLKLGKIADKSMLKFSIIGK